VNRFCDLVVPQLRWTGVEAVRLSQHINLANCRFFVSSYRFRTNIFSFELAGCAKMLMAYCMASVASSM